MDFNSLTSTFRRTMNTKRTCRKTDIHILKNIQFKIPRIIHKSTIDMDNLPLISSRCERGLQNRVQRMRSLLPNSEYPSFQTLEKNIQRLRRKKIPTTMVKLIDICKSYDWLKIEANGTIPDWAEGSSVISYGNSLIYYNGHKNSEIHVLNTNTSHWRKILTKNPLRGTLKHSTIILGKKMIMFGGYVTSNFHRIECSNKIYSLALDDFRWRTEESYGKVPCPRRNHTAALVRNSMFLFGGIDSNFKILGDFYKLDLNNNHWAKLKTKIAPSKRTHASSLALQNSFYLFGGKSPAGEFLYDLWMFSNAKWSLLYVHNSPNSSFLRASASVKDKIIIFGGHPDDGFSETLSFDTSTCSVKKLKTLDEAPCINLGHCLAVNSEKVIIVHGDKNTPQCQLTCLSPKVNLVN